MKKALLPIMIIPLICLVSAALIRCGASNNKSNENDGTSEPFVGYYRSTWIEGSQQGTLI